MLQLSIQASDYDFKYLLSSRLDENQIFCINQISSL